MEAVKCTGIMSSKFHAIYVSDKWKEYTLSELCGPLDGIHVCQNLPVTEIASHNTGDRCCRASEVTFYRYQGALNLRCTPESNVDGMAQGL